MKLRTLINFLSINWWHTLRFNLHYLPFSQAIKFPILVSYRTKVANLGGCIKFTGIPMRFGLLKLGFKSIGFQDGYYDRTVWQVNGNINLRGSANIGRGSKISVLGGGNLEINNNLTINGLSIIICSKSITIGENVLMSWGCTLMDTDFHSIKNAKGERVNLNREIIVGDHVWIGMNVSILKGSYIPNDSVIAAGSTISKKCEKEHCVYGSQGKLLKENITWDYQ